MDRPTGLIFALRSRYSTQDGVEALFNEANSTFSAAAAGNTAAAVAANNQVGTSPTALSGGSEYTAASAMSTATGEALGDGTGNHIPEMAFSVEQISVTAKTRKLKAEYTHELATDLKNVHNMDAEGELMRILTEELTAEINRELLRKMYISATIGAQNYTTTSGTINLDVDSNGRWSVEKWKGLMTFLGFEANEIQKATRRGRGNFLVVTQDVATALEEAGKLDTSMVYKNDLNQEVNQSTFAGVLNGRYKLYIDPYIPVASGVNFAMVGYKGSSPWDAGMYYCPYVPLQLMRAVGENTFQPKIAYSTRYGVVANPFATSSADGAVAFSKKNTYYRRVNITSLM